MKYAQIRNLDVANGSGIGSTLFVSGCDFHCLSCFNQEYQDFNYGQLWNRRVETQFLEMCKNPQVDHISILGGEPLQQDISLYFLLMKIHHDIKKPIWLWTGYTWEEIVNGGKKYLLNYIDILVDGKFIESQKDLRLAYRGSKNQRVIDVQESIKKGEVVLWG